MTNRQIQPVRRNDYTLARPIRPRGLIANVTTSLTQPGYFFRTLPAAADSRQWLVAALLILALIGLSAIRQEELLGTGGNSALPSVDFGAPPGTDLGFSGIPTGPFPGDSSGGNAAPPTPAPSPDAVSSTVVTALIAASHIVLGWFILAFLLSEVSLFNGVRPLFSQNLQIAIWSSVPLGIMAGLQLVYYAAGGGVGAAGISGLLDQWEGYQTQTDFVRSLFLSLSTRTTLFWVWSLCLIYIGARATLNGKRWAVLIVVLAWAIVLVVVPVVTGAIKAPEVPLPENPNMPSDLIIPGETIPSEPDTLPGSEQPASTESPSASSGSGMKG